MPDDYIVFGVIGHDVTSAGFTLGDRTGLRTSSIGYVRK